VNDRSNGRIENHKQTEGTDWGALLGAIVAERLGGKAKVQELSHDEALAFVEKVDQSLQFLSSALEVPPIGVPPGGRGTDGFVQLKKIMAHFDLVSALSVLHCGFPDAVAKMQQVLNRHAAAIKGLMSA